MFAGARFLKAWRANPSTSLVDHLVERSKVMEGLSAQQIERLRDCERSLQHLPDDARMHSLYGRAENVKRRESYRRTGKRVLLGARRQPSHCLKMNQFATCVGRMCFGARSTVI